MYGLLGLCGWIQSSMGSLPQYITLESRRSLTASGFELSHAATYSALTNNTKHHVASGGKAIELTEVIDDVTLVEVDRIRVVVIFLDAALEEVVEALGFRLAPLHEQFFVGGTA